MRELILWVHRWLGLTAGIVFAIAAGSGAVLVYQPELDRLLGGPRWGATEGTLAPEEIEAAVRAAYPTAPIRSLAWPVGAENAVQVVIDEGGGETILWIDNGSGRFLTPRRQVLVLLAIRRLHVNLLVGQAGRRLVIWTTWAALLALVLGAYLWWPGIRKLWTGFRVRLGRGAYILNFDLHQALGIVALPLLIFGSATGVLLTQGGLVDRIGQAVHGPPPEEGWGDTRSSPPLNGTGELPPLAVLADAAGSQAPGAYLTRLTMPATPDGVIEAQLLAEDGTDVYVALDRYTGAALASRSQGFRYDRGTNEALHVAHVGGPVMKFLYMLSCALGFVMLPTGVIMWWIKRKRKADSAVRRAEARSTAN